jgi:DNA polymerase-3 subunit epsilon
MLTKTIDLRNFTAIDFETANGKRSSACSAGIVVVRDGTIVERYHDLIKPTPYDFAPYNTFIHGITEDQVKDAPTFIDWYDMRATLLDETLVIAHNAAFDMSVLRYGLDAYNHQYPSLTYICTLQASRALINSSDYKLNTLCKELGIMLNHHNALSDAEASAQLLLKISEIIESADIKTFAKKSGINIGTIHYNGYTPCSTKHPSAVAKYHKNTESAETREMYIDDDFINKTFVFTGILHTLTRNQAHEIVALGGGETCDRITNNTDYLIVGEPLDPFTRSVRSEPSGKLKKALSLQAQNRSIQIINEDEFLKMIDAELWDIVIG